MSQYISVMTVGDIFDRTFKMIQKTYGRNLIISSLLTLPPLVLIILGLYLGIAAISDSIMTWEEFAPDAAEVFSLLIFPILLVFIGSLALFIGTLWAEIAVYRITSSELEEAETTTWQDALGQSGSKLLTFIGFYILYSLAVSALILVPYFTIILGTILQQWFLIIVALPILVAGIPFAVYLSIRWLFGLNAIASENYGAIDAFTRSTQLVQGKWWRTFGIMLLLYMVLSFAVSIVASPFMIFGFIGPYIDFIMSIESGIDPDPASVINMLSGIVWGYSLSIGISIMLTAAFQPVYLTVMYYDLRARNNEFPEEDTTTPPPDPDDTMQLGDEWKNISI